MSLYQRATINPLTLLAAGLFKYMIFCWAQGANGLTFPKKHHSILRIFNFPLKSSWSWIYPSLEFVSPWNMATDISSIFQHLRDYNIKKWLGLTILLPYSCEWSLKGKTQSITKPFIKINFKIIKLNSGFLKNHYISQRKCWH